MKRRAFAGLAPALVLLAACDIPSTTPQWDMTWNVPANSTTIGVSSFLPTGVVLNSAGTAFTVTTPAAGVTTPLSTYCPACNGTAPKPAFTGSSVATTSLPASVASAALATGSSSISVAITNNMGFDLINPVGAAAPGSMTITVTNGTTTLGTLTLNGSAGNTLPPGTTTRTIGLTGPVDQFGNPTAPTIAVNNTQPITITTAVNSPAGSTVTMNSASTVVVTGTPTVTLASASVALNNQSVSSTSTLDLKDIDETVSDRVNSGKFIATVTNPFAASGTLHVTFTGGSAPVVKDIALDAGGTGVAPSTKTVPFTGPELQSLLGHTVTVVISGTVTGGTVLVIPAQAVKIDTRLELNVNTKSSK